MTECEAGEVALGGPKMSSSSALNAATGGELGRLCDEAEGRDTADGVALPVECRLAAVVEAGEAAGMPNMSSSSGLEGADGREKDDAAGGDVMDVRDGAADVDGEEWADEDVLGGPKMSSSSVLGMNTAGVDIFGLDDPLSATAAAAGGSPCMLS